LAGTNGAVGVGAAASWSHGFFGPFEISGKGWTERNFPGKPGLGGGTTGGTNSAGEASFGALLLNMRGATVAAAAGGDAERGFCDCGDIGADVTGNAFADKGPGIMAGTGASVFSVDAADGLPADVSGGNFASDGVDDGLFADGAAGGAFSAFSEIENGEM
jgi:hypothetical protein